MLLFQESAYKRFAMGRFDVHDTTAWWRESYQRDAATEVIASHYADKRYRLFSGDAGNVHVGFDS